MMHDIGRELEARLVAKGCPFKVLDRETTKPTAWRNAVVIERQPDSTGPARSQSSNPKRYYSRDVGGQLTVYAQSTKSGAQFFEHEAIADQVVDLLHVALRTIAAVRKTYVTIGRGQFVPIADLDKSERPGGAVYVLTFAIGRGVEDRSWSGAADQTGTIGAVNGCTHVGLGNEPTQEACGDCGA